MSPKTDEKKMLETILRLLTDIRFIGMALGTLLGGGTMWAFGDGGATQARAAAIADSVATKKIEPVARHLARQDTAIIQIKFSLDVMMTDVQKARADSLMRSALKNINYGER